MYIYSNLYPPWNFSDQYNPLQTIFETLASLQIQECFFGCNRKRNLHDEAYYLHDMSINIHNSFLCMFH